MKHKLTVAHLQHALQMQDPELVNLFIAVIVQDEQPETPPRQDAFDYRKYLSSLKRTDFRKKNSQEQGNKENKRRRFQVDAYLVFARIETMEFQKTLGLRERRFSTDGIQP